LLFVRKHTQIDELTIDGGIVGVLSERIHIRYTKCLIVLDEDEMS